MLANLDKVELVMEKDNSCLLVAVVEAGEWGLPRAVYLLQEKLESIASYALDGQMTEQFPNLASKDISLKVMSVDPVPARVVEVLAKLVPVYKRHGINLEPAEQMQAA